MFWCLIATIPLAVSALVAIDGLHGWIIRKAVSRDPKGVAGEWAAQFVGKLRRASEQEDRQDG